MNSLYSFNKLSTRERNGKEGNGEDIGEVYTSPVYASTPSSNDVGTQLFEYWQKTMSHPRAKLDKKRQRTIDLALKLGYIVPELQKAIDGCKNTSFHMGQNDRNQVYDDITLILRDAEHIERFIATADKPVIDPLDSTSNNLMAGVL
ncbi:MAG: hypothetical protein QM652_09655 [Legionella sp.]|uniref:hypothetical protein n=1 Tax=Legionella sp. TaxID=459 RepID=UPI0039E35014